ncbi:MAG: ATP-binding protein [Streptosporangiaceae bacterium]
MLSLRAKLALLYAGAFFLAGGVLVTVGFLGFKQTARVGTPGQPAAHVTSGALLPQVIALIVLAVAAYGLGWLIAGRLLRPLRVITATAREISATNLHRRLSLGRGQDEFRELGETLDALFGRLEGSFESQRHFVANAAHELRTPLTAERTVLQVALADPGAGAAALRSACAEVLALGQQQERLIDALLTLASGEQGIERPEPFDLASVTGKVIAGRRAEAERRGVRLAASLAAAPASGDPSLAGSLVANLVDNALRHNTPGGSISVATSAAAGRAAVSVRNSGPVIPPGQVARLFQPFQRLGAERVRRAANGASPGEAGPGRGRPGGDGPGGDGPGGHGLGLAIVRAIADAHGAAVTARAQPEGGLDIEVIFGPGRPASP